MSFKAKLLMSNTVTHDTKRFVTTKPEGFDFEPGQGVELFIDSPEYAADGRPFTPTSRRQDQVLEFTIKRYPGDNSVTEALHALQPGAEFIIKGPFGAITYQGPGVFVAAGAGVTPFMAILRSLVAEGKLDGQQIIFSNQRLDDLIYGEELRAYLGDKALFTFTRERAAHLLTRRVDGALVREVARTPDQYFYLCGPDAFVKGLKADLLEWGVPDERLVYER